jgi:hypothetical protein
MNGEFIFVGAADFCASSGAAQFSEEFPLAADGGGEASSKVVGVVAQPDNKIAAKKMMPIGLNTRQLCGMGKRTQVVSVIYDFRFTIDAHSVIRS